LPATWPRNVKSAILHVISLAHFAIAAARGWAANSFNARVRLSAETDQLRQEVQLLREELRIKDARLAKIDPRHRPHYPAAERMAILELKAARGWSLAQVARAFLVEPDTITAWLKRIDEIGAPALVQIKGPVNKFPDFVRHVVQRLKTLCPSLGKVKIAQVLARAGLHLCATTVGRMLKAKPAKPKPTDASSGPARQEPSVRVVTAKYPNHVWHADLTIVPTVSGFWTVWQPFALPQCWPFCWWLAVVVDHFSRRVMGAAVFRKQPSSKEVCDFLAKTIRDARDTPKHIVCDKGSQFWCSGFKRWCRRRRIKPRFGAIGKHGSIAVIERFNRTLKTEGLRRVLLPLKFCRMRDEVAALVGWYNTHRPHTWLGGRTPEERYRRIPAACRRPRWEPRQRWPADSPCASPEAKVRDEPGVRLELVVEHYQERNHLPIVTLKRVA